jgi:ribosomal protein S18 acetylase RimI-like enzyme
MIIRTYRDDDLPVLRDMTVEAFNGVSIDHNIERHFGPIAGHDWRWRKARHVDDDVARQPDGVFVAEDHDQVVGYISTRADREAGLGLIMNIAVSPTYRGQGLGRVLIQHALDWFRSLGLSHAKIETLDQNPIGQHLYPSCGFQEVARQIHYVRTL